MAEVYDLAVFLRYIRRSVTVILDRPLITIGAVYFPMMALLLATQTMAFRPTGGATKGAIYDASFHVSFHF